MRRGVENVPPQQLHQHPQPLRAGTAVLKEASSAPPSAEALQQQLDRALAAYRGNDPLSVWTEHFSRVKTLKLPAEQEVEILRPVLRRCMTQFQRDARYAQSDKFLKVWINYATMTEEAEAVFEELNRLQLGRSRALFYHSYALVLEDRGQLRESLATYNEGIRARAEPTDTLVDGLVSFKLRHGDKLHGVAPQPAPTASGSQSPSRAAGGVPAYVAAAVLHEGREICFEEFRALCYDRNRKPQPPAAAAPVQPRAAKPPPLQALGPKAAAAPAALARAPSAFSFLSGEHVPASPAAAAAPQPAAATPHGPPVAGAARTPMSQAEAAVAPSPTVNTREALRDVWAMFADASPLAGVPARPAGSSRVAAGAAATEVLVDPTGTFEVLPPPAAVSFAVFDDCSTGGGEALSSGLHAILESSRELDGSAAAASAAAASPAKRCAPEPTAPQPATKRAAVAATAVGDADNVRSQQRAAAAGGACAALERLAGGAPFRLGALREAGAGGELELGNKYFTVEAVLAAPIAPPPAHQRVWLQVADLDADDDAGPIVLSLSAPADCWELHVSAALLQRMQAPALQQSDVLLARRGFVFDDCSCLVADGASHGSLQDVMDAHESRQKCVDEVVAMFYAAEMVRILVAVHRAGVVHGAVVPAAFAIKNKECPSWGDWTPSRKAGWTDKGLSLRDWSQAVDAHRLAPGAALRWSRAHGRDALPEETTQRPCLFEVDAWGVALAALRLLFGAPVAVRRDGDGWTPARAFRGHWAAGVWHAVLQQLLTPREDANGLEAALVTLTDALSEGQRAKQLKVQLCKLNIFMCDHFQQQ